MSVFYNQIATRYKTLLDSTELYLLTYPDNLPKYNLRPFGLEIPQKNILSCIDHTKKDFFHALQMLDKYSFGPVGMPMDKWVFFDCGEMPGGVVGLSIPASRLDEKSRKLYELPDDYEGIVPISMYIAIPMASGSWFGHNLCSANSFIGNGSEFAGLALLTKAIGVKVLNFERSLGATQWESGALNIHTQLSDMEIKSAYTPAHSFEKTITYSAHYTDQILIEALMGRSRVAKEYDYLVDTADNEFYKKMQNEIKDGTKFSIVGRPIKKDGKIFLPIKKG